MATRRRSGVRGSGGGRRRVAGSVGRATRVGSRNVVRLAEAQAAAGRVIAARLRGIAAVAAGSGDDPELGLMVTEKIEAANAALAAAAPHAALPLMHYAEWVAQCMALWSRCLALTGDPQRAWQRYVEGVALINSVYASAMLATMAEAGNAALMPAHKAVTGNDRRLRDR